MGAECSRSLASGRQSRHSWHVNAPAPQVDPACAGEPRSPGRLKIQATGVLRPANGHREGVGAARAGPRNEIKTVGGASSRDERPTSACRAGVPESVRSPSAVGLVTGTGSRAICVPVVDARVDRQDCRNGDRTTKLTMSPRRLDALMLPLLFDLARTGLRMRTLRRVLRIANSPENRASWLSESASGFSSSYPRKKRRAPKPKPLTQPRRRGEQNSTRLDAPRRGAAEHCFRSSRADVAQVRRSA